MAEYIISKSFTTRVPRSERVLAIAEAFGLGLEEREFHLFRDLKLTIDPGDVVYINGQSGSGKSQLLRELARQMQVSGLKVADIDEVALREDCALIDQIGATMQQAIEILALAGINDAYLMIRRPAELSDGQRYRLRMAKLLESDADVLVADEFGAILDRVTAKTVAFNCAKLARRAGRVLIVATTHTDLEAELGPSVIVRKHYQDRVEVLSRDVAP